MSHYPDQYLKEQDNYKKVNKPDSKQKLYYSNAVHGISILVTMLEQELAKQHYNKVNVDNLLEDIVKLAQVKL